MTRSALLAHLLVLVMRLLAATAEPVSVAPAPVVTRTTR